MKSHFGRGITEPAAELCDGGTQEGFHFLPRWERSPHRVHNEPAALNGRTGLGKNFNNDVAEWLGGPLKAAERIADLLVLIEAASLYGNSTGHQEVRWHIPVRFVRDFTELQVSQVLMNR